MALESLPEPSERRRRDAYVPPRIVERTSLDVPLIGVTSNDNNVCASFSSHPA